MHRNEHMGCTPARGSEGHCRTQLPLYVALDRHPDRPRILLGSEAHYEVLVRAALPIDLDHPVADLDALLEVFPIPLVNESSWLDGSYGQGVLRRLRTYLDTEMPSSSPSVKLDLYAWGGLPRKNDANIKLGVKVGATPQQIQRNLSDKTFVPEKLVVQRDLTNRRFTLTVQVIHSEMQTIALLPARHWSLEPPLHMTRAGYCRGLDDSALAGHIAGTDRLYRLRVGEIRRADDTHHEVRRLRHLPGIRRSSRLRLPPVAQRPVVILELQPASGQPPA